jgi:hypothetical protein
MIYRLILILFISTPIMASEPSFSLFLTEEEQAKFNKTTQPDINLPSNTLTLKAIMMTDKNNWAIWINEHKITPDASPDHIQVKHVSTDGVNLTWTTDQGPEEVCLKVNVPYTLQDISVEEQD